MEFQVLDASGNLKTNSLGDPVGVVHGGTGLAIMAQGDMLYADTTTTLARVAKNTNTSRYLSNGAASNNPAWARVDLTNGVTGALPIANGGNNSATALSGSSIMVSDGSKVIQGAAGTTSTVLHGNAASTPAYGAVALATEVSGVLPTANGGTSVDIASAALPLGSGQITFPASQNASAGANVLDDYEEGTWTPVIGGSGGTSGQTYTLQQGYYVKIGQNVWVGCAVQLSAKGTITTDVQIQGLPFTSNAGANFFSVGPVSCANLLTNWVLVQATLAGNVTAGNIRGAAAAGTANNTLFATADIGNTTVVVWAICYRATA